MNTSSYAYIAIDPVAFSLGPLSVHWYGIMYLLAFLFFLVRGNWLARHRTWWGWSTQDISDFLFYAMIGVVVGGRMGYVLFYALDGLLEDPLLLFKINQGGMSFHGGLVGVMLAAGWFAHRTHRTFWQVADFVAPLGTVGLGLGRLGNFIGGELWGRLADVPWAMIFPNSIEPGGWSSVQLREEWMRGSLDSFARHPSQLYQVVLEGIVLYALLAYYSRVPRPVGTVAGLFLAVYGCFRIAAEFFREPDSQLGFLAWNWLTMGMLLSLPMIALGLFITVRALRRAGAGDSLPRSGQGGK